MHGHATVQGPILAGEVDDVLAATGNVRGIVSVTNGLTAHESPDGIPALQGDGTLQQNWAPATQTLVTAAGLAATAVCIAAYLRR